MGMKRIAVMLVLAQVSLSLFGREIVVDVEPVPIKKMAVLFTPIVLPDLISAKAAFEYRINNKFNLVLPLEAKWMDYRRAIRMVAKMLNTADQNVPATWYKSEGALKPGWNIDIFQFKISSGIGAKWFPFSESMTNAFFVKGLFLAGFERLHAYGKEGQKDGAVFTEVLSIGYNWVKRNRFSIGFEAGQEYSLHTNAVKGMPILLDGFLPFLQFSLGFTI